MITVIFHMAYNYTACPVRLFPYSTMKILRREKSDKTNYTLIKFFMKRSSLFIFEKCLVWRLSDFSSVFNLPGISVTKPKFYCKFQIFGSNDEE